MHLNVILKQRQIILICDHYNRSRHTRKTCYILHGCLTRGRGGCSWGVTKPLTNHTSTIEATISAPDSSSIFVHIGAFSEEEVNEFCWLMSRQKTHCPHASLLAPLASASHADIARSSASITCTTLARSCSKCCHFNWLFLIYASDQWLPLYFLIGSQTLIPYFASGGS